MHQVRLQRAEVELNQNVRLSKKQRSTSTTPRSEVERAKAPFELDKLMGVGSVGSPSGEDTDSERECSDGEAVDQKSVVDHSDHSELFREVVWC